MKGTFACQQYLFIFPLEGELKTNPALDLKFHIRGHSVKQRGESHHGLEQTGRAWLYDTPVVLQEGHRRLEVLLLVTNHGTFFREDIL